MSDVIITVGIGLSRENYCKALKNLGYIIVDPYAIAKEVNALKISEKQKTMYTWYTTFLQLEGYLEMKKKVVFNFDGLDKKLRKRIVDISKKYNAKPMFAILLNSSNLEECIGDAKGANAKAIEYQHEEFMGLFHPDGNIIRNKFFGEEIILI